MVFQKAAASLDSPLLAHVIPVIFINVCFIIATPMFLVHLLTHPLTYFPLTKENVFAARRKYFYFFWSTMGPLLNSGDTPLRRELLEKARGTVLEIGAGVGDNVALYKRDKVTRLILVEPNTSMHPQLRSAANAAGYHESDGSLLLLGCGGAPSDEKALALAGVGPGSVDTVACIHVLCGIPSPSGAIEMYRKILKKGGLFIFYEHVRNDDAGMARWQTWYTQTVWRTTFDGCELDRPTGDWIVRGPRGDFGVGRGGGAHVKGSNGNDVNGDAGLVGGRWKEYNIDVPEGQPKYTLVSHVKGWAIKS